MLEGEGQADWMMATDFIKEYALAIKISEAEALEPHTLAEAKHHPDWLLWEKAIQEELETLHQARTWELAEAPTDSNIIGSNGSFARRRTLPATLYGTKPVL